MTTERSSASGVSPRALADFGPWLDYKIAYRVGDGGHSIGDAELLEDLVCVVTNGRRADMEPRRQHSIRGTGSQEPQDFHLAPGQTSNRVLPGRSAAEAISDEREQVLVRSDVAKHPNDPVAPRARDRHHYGAHIEPDGPAAPGVRPQIKAFDRLTILGGRLQPAAGGAASLIVRIA